MIGRALICRSKVEHIGRCRVGSLYPSCGMLFKDVCFEVRRGEVLGFYGLVGAGAPKFVENAFLVCATQAAVEYF